MGLAADNPGDNRLSADDDKGFSTRLVAAGRRAELTHGIVNPPVYRASTILFPTIAALENANANRDSTLYYGRRGTPTTWALQEALTELTPGGAGTRLFPSGLAAVAGALLGVLRAGDHLLMVDTVYEPTRALCGGLLARLGITTTYYDPMLGGDIVALFQPNTRAVFVESPGSLTFEVQDIPAIAAVAHQREAFVIADNTYGGPALYPVLMQGVDLSVVALTKYVVGHSDVLMGAVTANPRAMGLLASVSGELGQTVSPDDAFLALRGLRTLGVRMERQAATALSLARWLATHPLVDKVLHPTLPDCPGHNVFARDATGPAGLFSIVLRQGSRADAAGLVEGLRHFGIGFSWGGYESLALPVTPNRRKGGWAAPGPVIRLSIGLENEADLKADLVAGLDRYAAALKSGGGA